MISDRGPRALLAAMRSLQSKKKHSNQENIVFVTKIMAQQSSNAGPLDVNMECQFKCTVRKGDTRDNPRGGASTDFKVKISEGVEVLKARTLSFVRHALSNAQLVSDDIHFKKSKGASQSQHVILCENNFEDLTRGRWGLITKRDTDAWTSEGKTVAEGFVF